MAKTGLVKAGPRVLFWDIETSHNLVAAFKLFGEDYIPHTNLMQERFIICACWQWLGEDKVHSVSTIDDPKRYEKDHTDDYHVVSTLLEVLSEADIIVAHNGDAYDTKFLKGRALIHKLLPLPPIKSIDTLKVAKANFLLNSNRLDYIGKKLGLGGKKETKQGLWLEVLRGNKSAVKEMVAYNKVDVTLLRDVFLRLLPYMSEIVNRELHGGSSEECPRPGCGSRNVQRRGVHRAISNIYQRWQCQACGGWYRTAKADSRNSAKLRVL
jgi:hypothetical protein